MDDLTPRLQELEDGLPTKAPPNLVLDQRSGLARTALAGLAAIAAGLVVAAAVFAFVINPLRFGATASPSPGTSSVAATISPLLSPSPTSSPTRSAPPGAFVGILGHYSVCTFLHGEGDDETYELDLPDRYDLKTVRGEIRVVDRQETIVATVGDRVAIDGEVTGGGSYCASDPHLRVSEITVLETNPS